MQQYAKTQQTVFVQKNLTIYGKTLISSGKSKVDFLKK
jgi:hypothetical protein